MTLQLYFGIPFALAIATMVVLVGVLRYTGTELDGALHQLCALIQTQKLCSAPQDPLVSNALWL